jgi:hypothetical protein
MVAVIPTPTGGSVVRTYSRFQDRGARHITPKVTMRNVYVSSGNSSGIATTKILFILSGATYWVLKDGTR